ncbi:MAG: hypothetical protein NTZ29_12600 [Verrucomicrobia bacterium]|nr:hypothetical protein [Verrucomicrobiota bacterium]
MSAVFKDIVAVRLDFIVGSIVTMAVIAASPSSSLHRPASMARRSRA